MASATTPLPELPPWEFGERLRQARESADLSIRRLAIRVGHDYGYVAKLERGTFRRPSLTMIYELCDALPTLDPEHMALLAIRGAGPPGTTEQVNGGCVLLPIRTPYDLPRPAHANAA